MCPLALRCRTRSTAKFENFSVGISGAPGTPQYRTLGENRPQPDPRNRILGWHQLRAPRSHPKHREPGARPAPRTPQEPNPGGEPTPVWHQQPQAGVIPGWRRPWSPTRSVPLGCWRQPPSHRRRWRQNSESDSSRGRGFAGRQARHSHGADLRGKRFSRLRFGFQGQREVRARRHRECDTKGVLPNR